MTKFDDLSTPHCALRATKFCTLSPMFTPAETDSAHFAHAVALVAAVDALRKAGQAEGKRHEQAEAAMQQAVNLFKEELAHKSARLASLQADLKCVGHFLHQRLCCTFLQRNGSAQ